MDKNYFLYLCEQYLEDRATLDELDEFMNIVESGRYDDWIKDQIHRKLTDTRPLKLEKDADMPRRKADDLLRTIMKAVPVTPESKSHSFAADRHRFRSANPAVNNPAVNNPAANNPARKNAGKTPYRRATNSWKWVAAAMILLITFSTYYIGRSASGSATQEINQTAMQEVITSRGERTSLILGDGSRVILNAESRLQIPLDFGQNARSVILEGEAFFEIEHQPDLPFKVHTGDHIYTEVLGTRFNVQNYSSDTLNGMVQVVVEDGRVKLGSDHNNQPNSVEVGARQKGAIGPAGAISVANIPENQMSAYLGWTQGRLVFNDQPVAEIIETLGRWYDLEFTITDPGILQRRMSASFENDSVSEVLQVISHALQIDFIQEKREVRFY